MLSPSEPEPQLDDLDDDAPSAAAPKPLAAAPPPAPQPCHGYANGCRCPACDERVRIVDEHTAAGRAPYTRAGKLRPPPAPPKQPEQPWEPKPSRKER